MTFDHMIKKIAISIPSYNESKNIKTLIGKIRKSIKNVLIVIVDDSSPSENKKIRVIVKNSGRNIHLISRMSKLGRGSAVMEGFRYAYTRGAEYFFEMDADLAHDPADLQKFVDEILKTKAALVVGSRYMRGSKIVKWPIWRLTLSKIINFSLNIWLNLGISDYTNGYRLYNRKAVAFLLRAKLQERGFILLSEMAYKLKKKKFKIAEIPITFTDRTKGKSSMGLRELILSLLGAIRIRLQNSE